MKKKLILPCLLLCLFISCQTTRYVPVETIKTEYQDHYLRDSIVRYDSVFVKQKADTLVFERYRYLYKDRLIRDSIFINDTIRVPFPVEVVKAVKAPLSGWQNFQLWCGRIALVLALLVIIYFIVKLKKPPFLKI